MSKHLACSNWCQLNSKGSSDAYLLCLNKCPQEGEPWTAPSSLTFTGKTTSGVSVPSPVATASKTISSSSITRLLPTKPASSLVIAGKGAQTTTEQGAPAWDTISPSLEPGTEPVTQTEMLPSWLSQHKLLVAGLAAAAIFAGVMVVRSRKHATANPRRKQPQWLIDMRRATESLPRSKMKPKKKKTEKWPVTTIKGAKVRLWGEGKEEIITATVRDQGGDYIYALVPGRGTYLAVPYGDGSYIVQL